MTSTVSIMVCTYNRLELTKQMLSSLFEKTTYPFRLVVVDNGSQDGTVAYLKDKDWRLTGNELFRGVDLHFNKENLGISIARNQGLTIANRYGDSYLCTIDNDVEFVNNWLSDSVKFIEASPTFSIGINYEDASYPFESINGRECQLKRQGNLGSACMVFPRSLHEKIGYFITDYGLYSCEDSDWGWRARLAGYKLAYLEEMGNHLGTGENDTGEYREFKNRQHAEISGKFFKSCSEYSSGKRAIRIDFDGSKYLS